MRAKRSAPLQAVRLAAASKRTGSSAEPAVERRRQVARRLTHYAHDMIAARGLIVGRDVGISKTDEQDLRVDVVGARCQHLRQSLTARPIQLHLLG